MTKKMSKALKKRLDAMSDDYLISWLFMFFRYKEPIIEECTKEEYEANSWQSDESLSEEKLKIMCQYLFKSSNVKYCKEPIPKRHGLLAQMEIDNEKNTEYKYMKIIGYKNTLMLNSQMIEYLKRRRNLLEKITNILTKSNKH